MQQKMQSKTKEKTTGEDEEERGRWDARNVPENPATASRELFGLQQSSAQSARRMRARSTKITSGRNNSTLEGLVMAFTLTPPIMHL